MTGLVLVRLLGVNEISQVVFGSLLETKNILCIFLLKKDVVSFVSFSEKRKERIASIFQKGNLKPAPARDSHDQVSGIVRVPAGAGQPPG